MNRTRPLGETSEGLVLRMLAALGGVQGFDVATRLARELRLGHAEAYAVLYTLESRGLVDGRLEPTPEGGERRWYSLTTRGRLMQAKQAGLAGDELGGAFVPGGAV